MDDGIIYGLSKLTFDGKVFGYIKEEGLSAGGDAPSKTLIRAAQAKNAVVKVLVTTPGSKKFTFNLIQLKGANFQDVFGGSVNATTGVYTAPVAEAVQEGAALIEFESGHVLEIFRASLVGNLAGAISMSEVLSINCELEILIPEDGSAPFKMYPPGKYTTPEPPVG
jgi:hypothetical protein